MSSAILSRYESGSLGLWSDPTASGAVSFAFTERTGGVSEAWYSSLNLGDACGDEPSAVQTNRQRVLDALGCGDAAANLINPRQVHGDRVVVLCEAGTEATAAAQREAREGADAVVCTVAEVPVLLCFADCVPIVLVAATGFAVVHSGWRGAYARIAQKAAHMLCNKTGVSPREVVAYVGPHIERDDYEVSAGLAADFIEEFGGAAAQDSHLDLSYVVRSTLLDAGLIPEHIAELGISTASATDRFYSYRAEHGQCGRHGALAYMSA